MTIKWLSMATSGVHQVVAKDLGSMVSVGARQRDGTVILSADLIYLPDTPDDVFGPLIEETISSHPRPKFQ